VGIARTADADRYLSDVQRLVVRDMRGHEAVTQPGVAPAAPPRSRDIWAVSASGRGEQVLLWSVPSGEWTVVVMNADAAGGVHATVDIGATFPVLEWLGVALLAAGAVMLLVGVVLVVAPVRRSMR
jgi:hypothetical protein